MLIDTLEIKHSNNVANHIVSTPSQDRFINQWADLLESVGWTRVGSLHATGSLTYPLGAPVSDGIDTFPKTVVGCSASPGFFSIGIQHYSLYDPFHQIPGTTTACTFVPMGTTYAETFDNLIFAVSSISGWFATYVFNGGVSYTVNIEAVSAGPEFNEILLSSNGFASGQDVTHGGGWTMESSGDSSSTVYTCTMTAADRDGAGDNYLAGLLKFDFVINGEHVVYQLLNDVQGTLGFMGALGVGAVPSYQLIANPYGFMVFDSPRSYSTHQYRAVSLFAMAPYFPTDEVPSSEIFVPADAVFVVGPNNIGGYPSWNNPAMSASTMALDNVPFQAFGFNPSARLLALRSPTFDLYTAYGIPLYIGAYVQYGSEDTNTDPAWVVGKLWDCALVTTFVGGDGVVLGNRQFLTVGYGDGVDGQTVVSLLMECGNPPRVGFLPVGQSEACASAPGSPGETSYENSGH